MHKIYMVCLGRCVASSLERDSAYLETRAPTRPNHHVDSRENSSVINLISFNAPGANDVFAGPPPRFAPPPRPRGGRAKPTEAAFKPSRVTNDHRDLQRRTMATRGLTFHASPSRRVDSPRATHVRNDMQFIKTPSNCHGSPVSLVRTRAFIRPMEKKESPDGPFTPCLAGPRTASLACRQSAPPFLPFSVSAAARQCTSASRRPRLPPRSPHSTRRGSFLFKLRDPLCKLDHCHSGKRE